MKKINFWQLLGGVLLVIGAIGYIYEHYFVAAKPAATQTTINIAAPEVAPRPATPQTL